MATISCQNNSGERLGPGASKIQVSTIQPVQDATAVSRVRPANVGVHTPVA
jgi:hypothetical protein